MRSRSLCDDGTDHWELGGEGGDWAMMEMFLGIDRGGFTGGERMWVWSNVNASMSS
jgi:hypothetical protein